jgi:Zn-dependent protease with chaperone function
MALSPALAPLVHRKERLYYALMVGVSLIVYAGLGAMIVSTPEAAAPILLYGVMIPLFLFFIHGLLLGRIRGNGVRITPRQFPELHALAVRHAATLGLETLPEIFLMESGGILNAFATRFLGRDFVVIHSDVLAMAEAQGADAVSFILAHELAHLRRGHLKHRWLIGPGRVVPYLGAAYSRACEYTCDRFGAHCEPSGAIRGLVALASGPQLYRRVDVNEYAKQVETEKGFWVRRAELMSTHPHLPKRVAALLAAGVPTPGVAAPAGSPIRGMAMGASSASFASS